MTLYTYLRLRHFVELNDNTPLPEQAEKLANEIRAENITTHSYPTVESMWQELLRRAKQLA